MAQDARQPLQGGNPLFRQQQPGKQQPPQHKIPRRAVPQPRKHPHGEDVQNPPPAADPAAAHGDIHIVPKPAAKADVPPPPELRDASREVGIVKILDKMEPQHPPKADGHVGIAGKIEVNVQGEGHGVHPVKQDGRFPALTEQPDQQGKIVRENDLLPQPHQKPPQSRRRVVPALFQPFSVEQRPEERTDRIRDRVQYVAHCRNSGLDAVNRAEYLARRFLAKGSRQPRRERRRES